MSNIQIVTDSTAYFTKEEAKKYNIVVVPLSVCFEGEEFQEGFLDETGDFFERLERSKDFPTTSQPSAGAFASVYNEALKEGKEVLAIIFSSKISGTYNSAVLGAEMLESDKISVIDTHTSVGNLKHLVLEAHRMAEDGRSRQEILNYIEDQKTRMGTYLTVGSLDYLKKGGRLSNAQAFIGSILNIKPIIQMEDGILEGVAKTRGKKKALDLMISKIPEDVKYIYVQHILNEEEALEVVEKLKELFPSASVSIVGLGPVIGSHLGPKTIGFCYLW